MNENVKVKNGFIVKAKLGCKDFNIVYFTTSN